MDDPLTALAAVLVGALVALGVFAASGLADEVRLLARLMRERRQGGRS